MSATTSMLHVRVDDTLKTQATEALGAMGLTVSDAVRLLLHRVVAGAAGEGRGAKVFTDRVMAVDISAFRFD